MKDRSFLRRAVLLPAAALLFSFLPAATHKIHVYMIGDSTMCRYEPGRSPLTGWGMPFADFFDSAVVISNQAQSGRSTRTFIEEHFWQPISDSLQTGDYLFIQFGHNDEVPTKKSYTPEDDFRRNLVFFISEAKKRGVIPVLLTPVARRQFDSTGRVRETHLRYSEIIRSTSAAEGVILIDLDRKSQELLQELGPEKSKLLYNHLDPGENPHYPNGNTDDSHFNELGARMIAELAFTEIARFEPTLAAYVSKQRD